MKREEKFLIKQLERNKREVEKKKKQLERELQKEKLLSVRASFLVKHILSCDIF